ncbi:MAG: ATP-binding protein [Chloroflexales bacterium]|nr:ATP-binding protein [Chloroflexales bacterium]
MQQPDINQIPDESLAAEILTPLLIAMVLLAITAFGLLLIWQWQQDIWAYVLIGMFAVSAWAARRAQWQGRMRRAGAIVSCAFSLAPILSGWSLGLEGNPIIFLAPLGVILAALLVSGRAAFYVAWVAVLVLLVKVFWGGIDLQAELPIFFTMAFLLLANALFSWLAAYTIQGTILWALETATKSERREKLLRATQTELERAIRERDRLNDALQAANQKLDAARASAEAAYHSKAGFMAAMSHELRTPLNLIIGFSTAMLKHPSMYEYIPLPAAYRDDLTEIRRSGQHLLGLINDILELAKVEAGHLELNRVALNLDPLFDEVLHTTSGLLKDRTVLLRRDIEGPLPIVLADEVRVRQILLNLLSNACKFTQEGEIALGAQEETNELILWVRDTGIGIAPSDQFRIFSEFEQVETQQSRQQSGTGLGLSICRWLVELHGGRLWLESELGKGSRFCFSLPLLHTVVVEGQRDEAEYHADPAIQRSKYHDSDFAR